jgi:hypothetical protein
MNKILKLEQVYIKNFRKHIPLNILGNFDGLYYNHEIQITKNMIFNEPFADIIRINNFSGYIDCYIDGEKVDYRKLLNKHYCSGRKIFFRIYPDHNLLITPVVFSYTGYILKKE